MNSPKFAVVVAALAVLIATASDSSPAQAEVRMKALSTVFAQLPADEEPQMGARPLFVTNRRMTGRLHKAKSLLQHGDDYLEAIQLLQSILDNTEDFFYKPDKPTGTRFRSLRFEARRLIASLPQTGHRSYEMKYGPAARQMLADARQAHGVAVLEEVSRRFFHTKAGYEATHLLGTYHLDHSEPLAAAICFERLRKYPRMARELEPMLSLKTAICWGRAGMPQKSIETLMELKEATAKGAITLGGKQIAFFTQPDEALDWLVTTLGQQQQFVSLGEESWSMFRGNASRNALSAQASPVFDDLWSFHTIRRPRAEKAKLAEKAFSELRKLEAEYRKGSFLTLPAAHPLAIEDVVIFRTLENLRAVHLKNGKLLWEAAKRDGSYLRQVEQKDNLPLNRRTNLPTSLERFLAQRAWRDMTAGTLSSDGSYVFAVEDLGFLGLYYHSRRGLKQTNAPKDYNKLMGVEVRSGKLSWEVGGARGDHALDFAGTFFLGPPLPLAGQLYCLVEISGEIRLLVLEPKPQRQSAELTWSQSLLMPEESLLRYPVRRLSGISPSYGDGVMVCPTAAGAVVALDLGRRQLLWGYRYPTNIPPAPTSRRALILRQMMPHSLNTNSDNEDRWIDSVPTIAEGRVLLTPRDSHDLHCLNLLDGEVCWKKPREQGLYVAAVYAGKVIVVGRSQVQAWNLADGMPVWKEPTPISMPSGRGFRTDAVYHLPLSTGEVATIDLDSGRILARSKSRSGHVPGNLIATGGMIVSQSVDTILGFKPVDVLEKQIADGLKKNPDDPTALALRGEMRLHRGESKAGLSDLRRSKTLKPDSRTRSLVVSTLLEGLRLDFAKYRYAADGIEKFLDDPQQRSRYLRLYAAGLQKVGERQAAFAAFLKLAGPDTGEPRLERVDGSLSVRGDRWLRPRVAELYRSALPSERPEMDRGIRVLLDSALKTEQAGQLRKFLNCFGNLAIADEARRALVDRLDQDTNTLELEFQLRRLRQSADRSTAAFATARLVSLLLASEQPDHVADLLDELAGKFAEVVCLDQKTGRELVEGWRADEKIGMLLAGLSPWPKKQIAAKRSSRRGSIQRFYPVKFIGSRGPFYENVSLKLDQRRQYLIASTGNGREWWRLSLKDTGRAVLNVYGNYARVHGHLMVLVLGNHFLLLDTLSASDAPAILWKRDLLRLPQGQALNRGVQLQQLLLPAGRRQIKVIDPYGRPMGTVGPITDELLCYQVGTTLFAADPLTGETLWERRNTSRGSQIFGDNEHVFVVSSGGTQAMVLRAADGQYLGTRSLPGSQSQMSTLGRRVLSWRQLEDKSVLSFIDALTGNTIWRKELASGAKPALIKGDEVAVLEAKGHFQIISLDDGKLRVDSNVQPTEGLTRLIVRRCRDRYLMLSQHRVKNLNNFRAVGVDLNNPLVNGYVYGFDRESGKKQWTTKIEQQAIDLSQPDDLPVLVLAVRTYKVFRQVPGFNQKQFAVLVLDQRNGRVVYRHQGPESPMPFELNIDLDKKEIDVNSYRSTIALTFTDKALAEPTPFSIQKPADD